jgi:hypothetical protein
MIADPKKLELIKARKQLLELMESFLKFAAHLPPGERYAMYTEAARELGKVARAYKAEIDNL